MSRHRTGERTIVPRLRVTGAVETLNAKPVIDLRDIAVVCLEHSIKAFFPNIESILPSNP